MGNGELGVRELVGRTAELRDSLGETAGLVAELLERARPLGGALGLDDRQLIEWLLAETLERDEFQLDHELLEWLRGSGFSFREDITLNRILSVSPPRRGADDEAG